MLYHNLNPVLLRIGLIEIRYYGLFYALGFLIVYILLPYLAKRRGLPISRDDAGDFILYAIVGVVAGARFFYAVFYNPKFYIANPLEIIALWHGGLSFHGGMIGGIIACFIFCKKKKIAFLDLADIVVIPVAIALSLGRIANFINGELIGRVASLPWCIDYSKNQFIQNIPKGCRHPSQIYESLKNLAIFGILWSVKDRKLPRGFMFWSYIALYGLFRTAVEFFRQPDEQIGLILNYFTLGQLLSFPMFLLGSYMIYRIIIRKK